MESSLSFPHVNQNKQFQRRPEGRKCFEAQVRSEGKVAKPRPSAHPCPTGQKRLG